MKRNPKTITRNKNKAATKVAKRKQANLKAQENTNPSGLDDGLSPFSLTPILSEEDILTAWQVLGDEDFVLDEEIWNNFSSRIRLELIKAGYAFRLVHDGDCLLPWTATPAPAFRSQGQMDYLKASNFTVLRPELPGVVFDLKISAGPQSLLLEWVLRRSDAGASAGHMALYCDGELVEAVNLRQNRCQMELTAEDTGDIAFYFLDAETGRQTKVLEISL
ncbi:MAG: hypothetical protein N2Z22_04300 [Turneriella sp.]|nr:hypothetical protein [Turneriella sp.]